MAVSKTLLSPRPFSATGRQEARAHPEPMDAEGVSFGARFALAGSVVDRDHAPRPQRRRPIFSQLRSTDGKYVHLCSANNEPEVLEESADLIFKIALDLDE
jgi:hypothetical protein